MPGDTSALLSNNFGFAQQPLFQVELYFNFARYIASPVRIDLQTGQNQSKDQQSIMPQSNYLIDVTIYLQLCKLFYKRIRPSKGVLLK